MRACFTPSAARAAWLATLLVLIAPGFAFAQAETPLTVEKFTCRGNESATCDFILSYVYLRVGQPVDERELREASVRLAWLRNFDSVSIFLEKGTERGRANVVIEVHEANPITYEGTLGFFSQASSVGQFIQGRATHYNVFGDGKIMDVQASTLLPISGPVNRGQHGTVQYIDPHVFGSKRDFASASLWYQNERREWDNGDVFFADQVGMDLVGGHRLWGFSYVSAGYRFRPISNVYGSRRNRVGIPEIDTTSNHGGVLVNFGWNSENEPYFPTEGSRLHVGYVRAFDDGDNWSLSYRKNWQFGADPGVLTLIYDLHSALSVQYARPTSLGERYGVRRARWYIAPFLRPYYNKFDGGMVREVGATAGVHFETKDFGIVHFFVFGSGVSVAGDN